MDLGLFKRRRYAFWLWLVCPLVALVAAHLVVYSYCRHISEVLQEQRAMAVFLPFMEDALSASERDIDRFSTIRNTAAQAQATLNTRISKIASQHGFELSTLRINSLKPAGPINKLEIEVEGRGGVLAIMKFTSALQSPESLMALIESSIRINKFAPSPTYNCAFVFEAGFAPQMRVKTPPSGGHTVGEPR
jgi:hypothetical protein